MHTIQVMKLLAYYQVSSRHCTPCCFTKYAVMQCPFVLITNLHKRNTSSVVTHAPEQQHRGPIAAGGDENRLNTHTHTYTSPGMERWCSMQDVRANYTWVHGQGNSGKKEAELTQSG